MDPGGSRRPSLSISLRIGSDVGARADLNALLSLCGRAIVKACPFSAGSAAATRRKFTTLLGRLLKRPIVVRGTPVTYSFILGEIAEGLDISHPFQSPRLPPTAGSQGWLGIAGPLQEIWTASSRPSAAHATAGRVAGAAASERYAGPEQFDAIACGDTPNSRSPQHYNALEPFVLRRCRANRCRVSLGRRAMRDLAGAGRRGPWNRRTANPILVVGNTADPATPHGNAVKMTAQLGRARLLTVVGYGHTELLNPSACASRYISSYRLRGSLPPRHTVCKQNRRPFSP